MDNTLAHQIGVDFIRDDPFAIFLGDVHNFPQFLRGPDPAHRIVRAA